MRYFISGGCKNGKSYYAQVLAKEQSKGSLYYLATMRPTDDEDKERIKRHIADRDGWGFNTVELGENIDDCLSTCDVGGSFLLDSTTALLANEMFLSDGSIVQDAHYKVANDVEKLILSTENIVIVSDYIFSDAFEYDIFTEQYRKGLAYIDRRVASICDTVLEVIYQNIICHKGNV